MFQLSNELKMPALGLGTYQMNEEQLRVAIPAALDCGYRLFDTATSYTNESYIGKILAEELPKRGLTRSSVFITSKLRPADQGYDKTIAAIHKSAAHLGGYVDLYLIHWPGAAKIKPSSQDNRIRRMESWRAMEDLLLEHVKTSIIRGIGVSNYHIRHLEDIVNDIKNDSSSRSLEKDVVEFKCRVVPMVNQVEVHPCHHPIELIEYCRKQNIHVQAYASFGCGKLLESSFLQQFPRINEIACTMHLSETRNADMACTCPVCSSCSSIDVTSDLVSRLYLRWALQNGYSVLPKSRNRARLITNNVFYREGNVIENDCIRSVMECMGSLIREDDMHYLNTAVQEVLAQKFCWDSVDIV